MQRWGGCKLFVYVWRHRHVRVIPTYYRLSDIKLERGEEGEGRDGKLILYDYFFAVVINNLQPGSSPFQFK